MIVPGNMPNCNKFRESFLFKIYTARIKQNVSPRSILEFFIQNEIFSLALYYCCWVLIDHLCLFYNSFIALLVPVPPKDMITASKQNFLEVNKRQHSWLTYYPKSISFLSLIIVHYHNRKSHWSDFITSIVCSIFKLSNKATHKNGLSLFVSVILNEKITNDTPISCWY